jgi:hypothetical protein
VVLHALVLLLATYYHSFTNGKAELMRLKTCAIPALKRLMQEDGEFEARIGCTVRPCLKKTNK